MLWRARANSSWTCREFLVEDFCLVQLIKSRDYVRKPWKNGGGILADIAMAPDGAGLDAFDWRISTAHVGMDGPFSLFPGIDRSMVILGGEGMRLDIAGQPPVVLGTMSDAHSFPGDAATHATLTAGPVDDLNVMTKRGHFSHTMQRERLAGARTIAPAPGGVIVVYVEAGTITTREDKAMIAAAGDTLVFRIPTLLSAAPNTTCCIIDIKNIEP